MMIDEDDVEGLLLTQEMPVPPANFTVRVMAAVHQDIWQVEQAVDIGFNLAIGAGVFLIVGGALSFLWSSGSWIRFRSQRPDQRRRPDADQRGALPGAPSWLGQHCSRRHRDLVVGRSHHSL